jgi:hypothetical protein
MLSLDGGVRSISRAGHLPPGKGSRYPLNGRLGGPQSRGMKVHKHNVVMIVYILVWHYPCLKKRKFAFAHAMKAYT